jgi:murein L,D-transpeptidase YcbB/YkuD
VPQYRQFKALSAKYRALEPKSAKAIKMRKNIERIKLMQSGLGSNYALVNIPEFYVRVIEKNKEAIKMKVIVGTPKNKTPIFTGKLQYVVLNPQWSVPSSIAKNEIIPALIRNPNYLSAKNMIVRKGYASTSPNVNPSSVNWKQYAGKSSPYNFIQKPSGRNALGRVKFIFPNGHSVYMHDTPNKNLFNAKVRTFSHGCIRLQKPVDMLDHISTHYSKTGYPLAKKWYDSRKMTQFSLNKKLPVHTAYLTTYVDDKGVLISSPDAYGYDSSQKLKF